VFLKKRFAETTAKQMFGSTNHVSSESF